MLKQCFVKQKPGFPENFFILPSGQTFYGKGSYLLSLNISHIFKSARIAINYFNQPISALLL